MKIFFPRSEEDNIYKSYALCEIDSFPKYFFGKQPIENKFYFHKSFLLTNFFFMLPNIEKCGKLFL